MRCGAARRRFFRLLEAEGTDLGSVSPAQGLDLMLRSYRFERYRGCEVTEGYDLLSASWGTRHWNRSDWFEFEITRRLYDSEAERGRLLRLILRFPARGLSNPPIEGVLRCSGPAAVEEFRRRVKRSAGFRAVAALRPAHADLLFPTLRP